MHERERQRIILSAVQDRPVVTVVELCTITGASEATIRRDIVALDAGKKLNRIRGGAESITPPQFGGLAGRPFSVNKY
jgi:DeoR family ulaG and ulaABCDEF operon transcriptional repressor